MNEKAWIVTFEYHLEVTADTEEEAGKLAWEDWTENFGSVSPTDFHSAEPFEICEVDRG